MILGGPENEARVRVVEDVMARNGFAGPCFATFITREAACGSC